MEPKIIGIKQLHKELSKISEKALKGQSFLVVKNSKPVFRIEPVKEEKEIEYSLADYKKVQFTCRDKNLSKKIDKILYEDSF